MAIGSYPQKGIYLIIPNEELLGKIGTYFIVSGSYTRQNTFPVSQYAYFVFMESGHNFVNVKTMAGHLTLVRMEHRLDNTHLVQRTLAVD